MNFLKRLLAGVVARASGLPPTQHTRCTGIARRGAGRLRVNGATVDLATGEVLAGEQLVDLVEDLGGWWRVTWVVVEGDVPRARVHGESEFYMQLTEVEDG